jgi:nucleotide-binding universal stress UspA family protein
MESIKKIVYCTDFSQNSLAAFGVALDLAKKYQANLTLLHVVPPLVFPSPVMEEFISEQTHLQFTQDVIKGSEEQINRNFVQKMGSFPDYQIKILSGHPSAEILSFLEENEADLVVLGTHGLTGLAHFFLGSTAEKIVRRSPCSVLTIKSKAGMPPKTQTSKP